VQTRNGDTENMKLLDCFCGMGGVSDGFALEGFDVTGIDIVDAPKMLGYKHKFIQADMLTLKGEDFRDYDVVWGSPPCRDFCELARVVGFRWKNPPSPEKGLLLVNAFLSFTKEVQPKIWIMENNHNLSKHLSVKARIEKALIGETMKRSFWGNFPNFLMPIDMRKKAIMNKALSGKKGFSHLRINGKIPKNESWERARIPLACSRAFAKACKEQLEVRG